MIIVSKLANSFNVRSGSAESLENSCDVRTILHGNDSELILFINPDEEGFVIIVEDTSSLWPVSVEVACS